MSEALFVPWDRVARVVVVCVLAYLGLIVLLRGSGKRTTSKLNVFDWVVTVALGSMLAQVILSDSVPLVLGLVAFATLIGLQFVLAWLSLRVPWIRGVIKAKPALLYFRGEFLRDRMRAERITEEEIHAAVREAGHGSLEEIEAVILETNAELSAVGRLKGRSEEVSTLRNVPSVPVRPETQGGANTP
ncbi:MAG: DUF421 domain-containing protein [Gemmatimonadetes bacterium]|nr:DUF421 domain-containing protein [Gemmatimonadota bacterium]